MPTNVENLPNELNTLVIFRNLWENPVLIALRRLLEPDAGSNEYAAFAHELFQWGTDLTTCLFEAVRHDVNAFVLDRARGKNNEILELATDRELGILERLSRIDAARMKTALGIPDDLPEWTTQVVPFRELYREFVDAIPVDGYGKYLDHLMFTTNGHEILPAPAPDPVRLSDLKGYELQRTQVLDNTLALLEGRPAANTLLYGDAGTGKSSTVKAIVNELGSRGLRLVEVRKSQLYEIPSVVRELSDNPLRFIIFIDDLSFTGDNEEIGSLKAILEGGVCQRTGNLAIYATSNRRHLIQEKFSDRGDDDIHANETIQEQVSLSDRFGLSIPFSRPDKSEYLSIVRGLMQESGLDPDAMDTDFLAERYALYRSSRSPRIARHFVDKLLREQNGTEN